MTEQGLPPDDGNWPLLMDRACLARYLSLSDEQLDQLIASEKALEPHMLPGGLERWFREQVGEVVRYQCRAGWPARQEYEATLATTRARFAQQRARRERHEERKAARSGKR